MRTELLRLRAPGRTATIVFGASQHALVAPQRAAARPGKLAQGLRAVHRMKVNDGLP
ncbi:MAG: hypothetical protein QE285_09705 [Aquabacterium sp.]|nr:hypothetical protein [Aquabacterium sp.]